MRNPQLDTGWISFLLFIMLISTIFKRYEEVPSLYLYGQHDPLCPPELGREMADRTPSGRFLEIANSGHLINIEQPQAFNQAVLHFWKMLRQSGKLK